MPSQFEQNPFIGPRPIELDEPLFGRDPETLALFQLLQARRIVVLHSPSGAGKSSLVQAGLIPRLIDADFDVWRTIRVNLDPARLGEVPADTNRYLLSTLVSLEEELPEPQRRSPAVLATIDLLTYLRTRTRRPGCEGLPLVLIFDQFEEVLTIAPLSREEKLAFFDTLGRALVAESIWVLFVIREDFLAAFTPYRDRIPTQMANTLRLDLLGVAAAREVAVQLARSGGRTFPGVERLVHDLCTVQVQQPDGSFLPQQGPYVEPVHLQVVCRRLWSAMPADDAVIDEEDLAAYGDISTALSGYYSDSIKMISAGSIPTERAIRDWMGKRLISGGVRSQVRREPDASGGLANHLITTLEACYLVRKEPRAGADWFELAHDRLVRPILRDNQAWFRAHLSPTQVRAQEWHDANQPDHMLLSGDDLERGITWSHTQPADVSPMDVEFLQRSRAQEAAQATNWQVGARDRNIFAALCLLLGIAIWQLSVAGVEVSTTIPPWKLSLYAGLTLLMELGIVFLFRHKVLASEVSRRFVNACLLATVGVTFHRALYALDDVYGVPKRTAHIVSIDLLIVAVITAVSATTLSPWIWRLVPTFLVTSVLARLFPDRAGLLMGIATVINVLLSIHAMKQRASPSEE